MRITGELVIHIGPPKTATTSLQYFFQNLNHEEIFYGGICQPRSRNIGSICKTIYNYSSSDKLKGVDEAIQLITRKLNIGKNVFLSEELFLVDSSAIVYENKLRKIFDILKIFNPTILIVLREPFQVLASYFAELYNQIGDHRLKKFESFVNSPYCEIYKYKSLERTLKNIGWGNIICLEYEKLIASKYYISDIYNKIRTDYLITLDKKNETKIIKNTPHAKPVLIKRAVSERLEILRDIPFFRGLFGKGLGKILPQFMVGGKPLKTDISLSELNVFIKEYNEMKMGIDYLADEKNIM